MLNKELFSKIGSIIKPYSVSGEVLIRLQPDLCGKTITPAWLFINIDGGLVPFWVISSKEKGNNTLIVKLDAVDSEKLARTYQNCEIYVKPEEIIISDNEENKQEIFELKGFTVFDTKHGNIGIIENIIDIQQNPLMEILFHGKEILIPLQDDFIISIDKKKKELHVKTPEGLIELFLD